MSKASSTRIYWACQIGAWGYLTGFGVYSSLARHMPLPRAVVEPVVGSFLGLCISHVVLRFVQRRRWLMLNASALVARGIGAACVMALSGAVCSYSLKVGYYGERPEHLAQYFIEAALGWFFLSFGWIATYLATALYRQYHEGAMRSLQLERALQAAELRSLKSQLNPHFLFNSMNSIRALISDEPERARDAITELSRTLRYTLRAHQEEFVQLERECQIVDDYLALESLRLGERLTVERDISRDASKARIPPMLLQTIVENAIKHGIARLPAGGVLRVSACVTDGTLVVQVDNPRPRSPVPSSSDVGDAGGIGLANASERLRLMFGTSASLELELSQPDRAVARLCIPQEA